MTGRLIEGGCLMEVQLHLYLHHGIHFQERFVAVVLTPVSLHAH